MTTCSVPACNLAARWHDTLCDEHVKQLPPRMQNDVARISATLLRTRRTMIFDRYAERYRRALSAAARKVSA